MKFLRLGLPVLLLALFVPVTALMLFETGALPYKLYVIHTGSMYPTIPPRSAVVVEEHDYHVGQVISFVEHGMVVTHRLISINSNGTITTKGDANRTVDPWHVYTSSIIGGVVAAPHFVGYSLIYIRNPEGMVSILLGFLCIWQIWTLTKELDNASAEPRGT